MANSLTSRLPRWAVIRNARRRQRRRLARRALVMVALAALGAGLLTQRTSAGGSSPAAAARLSSTEVGGDVLQAQATGSRIWVLTCVRSCGAADAGLDREQLVEVDAGSGAVIRRLPLPDASAFTVVGRSAWVAHFISGDIARINPANRRITAQVKLRLPAAVSGGDRQFFFLPVSLSSSGSHVWVSTARGWLAEIDAHTGKLVRMVPTPSEDNATTTDRYGTWVAEDLDGFALLAPGAKRLRIHTVMQAGLPLDVYSVIGSGRELWALGSPDDSTSFTTVVLRIDPLTDRVIGRVRVPTADSGAVISGGALYLADLARGRIYRVSSDGTLATFSTPRQDAWLATASRDALWATTSVTPRQKHGQMLRISLPLG